MLSEKMSEWVRTQNRMSQQTTLARIAHGRSGDKGNHANIAIIAYSFAGFAWLADYFDGRSCGRLVRAARADCGPAPDQMPN